MLNFGLKIGHMKINMKSLIKKLAEILGAIMSRGRGKPVKPPKPIPVPTPIPTPVPTPTPVPVPVPIPDPVPVPIPEPTPIPIPTPEPIPIPTPVPEPTPIPEPIPLPIPIPDPTPIPQPIPAPNGTVGPHTNWNGSGGSGQKVDIANSSLGGDPKRLTAKPILSWVTKSYDRFVETHIIAVQSFAKGGIKNVTFYGDIETTVVSEPTILVTIDCNGVTHKEPVYQITLDRKLFTGLSDSGTIHIYAKATPNDPTMQERVIGGPVYDLDNSLSHLPMELYPRTKLYDFECTVGTTGTYKTLKEASTALRAAGSKSARTTIVTTGIYDFPTNDNLTTYTGMEGYWVIEAADGVTATIDHSPTFNPYDNEGNYWTKNWRFVIDVNQIHWKGKGIVIDSSNWQTYMTTNHKDCVWFDGVTITERTGDAVGSTMHDFHFNGSVKSGFSMGMLETGLSSKSYWEYCNVRRQAIGGFAYRVAHNNFIDAGAGRFLFIKNLVGNYVTKVDPSYPFYGLDVATFKYTSTDTSVTSASVESVGFELTNPAYIAFKENGVEVYRINIPSGSWIRTKQPMQMWSEVIADLNSWSATRTTGTKNAWFGTQIGKDLEQPAAFCVNNGKSSNKNAFNTTATMTAGHDIHSEAQQFLGGPNGSPAAIEENQLWLNNAFIDVMWTSCQLNNGNWPVDNWYENNIFSGKFENGHYVSIGPSTWTGSHNVMRNNYFSGPVSRSWTLLNEGDKYCLNERNIFSYGPDKLAKLNGWSNIDTWRDNACSIIPNGLPAGTNDTGNFSVGSEELDRLNLFTNPISGDFRPKAGSVITVVSNLKPRVYPTDKWDIDCNERADKDSVGPIAMGYNLTLRPF